MQVFEWPILIFNRIGCEEDLSFGAFSMTLGSQFAIDSLENKTYRVTPT